MVSARVDRTHASGGASRDAMVTVVATILTFLAIAWGCRRIGVDQSLAITGAAFALILGRRAAAHGVRLFLFELITLPLIALVAAGVAFLFVHQPIAGATVFVVAVALSVYLRGLGSHAKLLAGVIATPLIAMLVVPPPPAAKGGGPLSGIVLAMLAAVIALLWVRLTRSFAEWTHIIPRAPDAPAHGERPRRERKGLSATEKMALQMAVALAVAFVLGKVFFASHWTWTVVTAFIVSSGNRGREDVVYKSGLRLAGALAGTLVAYATQALSGLSGAVEGTLIFAALFLGAWLRTVNYAYWAACITLVIALLQRMYGGEAIRLDLRLVEIAVGALCGIAAAWLVFPIRTESVATRWLADALASLDAFARDETLGGPDGRRFRHQATRLAGLRGPLSWHQRMFKRDAGDHPAAWIAPLRDCADALVHFKGDRRLLLRPIGAARKALGERVRGRQSDGSPQLGVDEALQRLNISIRDALRPKTPPTAGRPAASSAKKGPS